MGEIFPPSSYISKNIFRVGVGNKNLKMTIFETENIINIYIGGPTLYCIHASINKENSVFVQRGIYDKSVGTIEQIYYNRECSLEHNFARGVDTNMIILLVCQYIRDNYPYVSYLKFNDASSRTCDNGTATSLAAMTYLYSGLTWYQKNFEAIMAPNAVAKFNNLIEAYNARKQQYTWAAFREIFIKGPLPLSEEEMQEMYEVATTWRDFFGPLKERIKVFAFCNFISPWLPKFIADILKHEFMSIPYMFVLERLRPVEYTLMTYSTGGRRRVFTKKNRRRAPRNEM